MNTMFIIFAVSAALTLWLYAAWLDSKKGWNLIGWINGVCSNPFKSRLDMTQSSIEKDRTILELKERIQTLEKIVTEPAYELNKKINDL